MNDVQLVTITYRGLPVFRYVTGAAAPDANSEAGALLDSLADCYGDGFGYCVRAVPFRRSIDPHSRVFDAARKEYETGAWLQLGIA